MLLDDVDKTEEKRIDVDSKSPPSKNCVDNYLQWNQTLKCGMRYALLHPGIRT